MGQPLRHKCKKQSIALNSFKVVDPYFLLYFTNTFNIVIHIKEEIYPEHMKIFRNLVSFEKGAYLFSRQVSPPPPPH